MDTKAIHVELPSYLSLDNTTSAVTCIVDRESKKSKSGPPISKPEARGSNGACRVISAAQKRATSLQEPLVFSANGKRSSTLPAGARKAVYIRKRPQDTAGDKGQQHVAECGVGIHKHTHVADRSTGKHAASHVPGRSGGLQKHAKKTAAAAVPSRAAKPELLELKELTPERPDRFTSKDSPSEERSLDVNENTRLLSPCGLISPNDTNNSFIAATKFTPWLPHAPTTATFTEKIRCYDGLKQHDASLQTNAMELKPNRKRPQTCHSNPNAILENPGTKRESVVASESRDLGAAHKPFTPSHRDIYPLPCSREQSDTKSFREQRQKAARLKRRKRPTRSTRSRDKLDEKSRDRCGRRGYRNEVFDLRSVVGDEILYGADYGARKSGRGADTSWLKTKPPCEGRCDICEDEISDGDVTDDDVTEDTKIFLFTDLLRNLLHCRFLQYR